MTRNTETHPETKTNTQTHTHTDTQKHTNNYMDKREAEIGEIAELQ